VTEYDRQIGEAVRQLLQRVSQTGAVARTFLEFAEKSNSAKLITEEFERRGDKRINISI
jgi:hypothetical protein